MSAPSKVDSWFKRRLRSVVRFINELEAELERRAAEDARNGRTRTPAEFDIPIPQQPESIQDSPAGNGPWSPFPAAEARWGRWDKHP